MTNYKKEINCITDGVNNIECVNLSIGADNIRASSWIVNNFEKFRQESISIYNAILSSKLKRGKEKLYFIVYEQKNGFSLVEKHLGIWHRYKDIPNISKSKDFYINNNIRYAYMIIDILNIEQLSVMSCGLLVFLTKDSEIADCLKEVTNQTDILEGFYNKGYLLAEFRDLYTEGNVLVFYSKNKQNLREIVRIAESEGFITN